MQLKDMRGKQVLVTGAASGIGRATALAFAGAGAGLVLTDISGEALEATRQQVLVLGVPCLAFRVNMADAQAVTNFAAEIMQAVGVPDVLVNNAGVAYLGSFLDTPLSAWQRVLDVNLMGVVHCCRHFLPAMRAASGARYVLNVASVAAIAPAPNMGAYAASKFAVQGLTEALQLELAGSNVTVTAVLPGIINTDIIKSPRAPAIGDAQLERLQAYYRRTGCAPEVVAQAMLAAVRGKRQLVLTGPMAVPLYHLKRISRSLLRNLTLRFARASGYA